MRTRYWAGSCQPRCCQRAGFTRSRGSCFDQRDVEHRGDPDLQPFGIYVLAFRDPDNIQVELTAPHDG